MHQGRERTQAYAAGARTRATTWTCSMRDDLAPGRELTYCLVRGRRMVGVAELGLGWSVGQRGYLSQTGYLNYEMRRSAFLRERMSKRQRGTHPNDVFCGMSGCCWEACSCAA
jgi:hypothetical protein